MFLSSLLYCHLPFMVASFVADIDVVVLIPQISFTVFGEVVTHNLKPKGDRIPVTKENRQGIKLLLPNIFIQ